MFSKISILDIFTAYDYQRYDILQKLLNNWDDPHDKCIGFMFQIEPYDQHEDIDCIICKITNVIGYINKNKWITAMEKYKQLPLEEIDINNIPEWVRAILLYLNNLLIQLVDGPSLINNEKLAAKLIGKYSKYYFALFIRSKLNLRPPKLTATNALKYAEQVCDLFLHLKNYEEYVITQMLYVQNFRELFEQENITFSFDEPIYFAKRMSLKEPLSILLFEKGMLNYGLRNYSEAIGYFMQSLETGDISPYQKFMNYLWLAKTYLNLGTNDIIDNMIAAMEDLISAHPELRENYLRYIILVGRYYRKQGLIEESNLTLKEGLQEFSKLNIGVFVNNTKHHIVINYLIQGKYNEALNILDTVKLQEKTIFSTHQEFYFFKSQVLLSKGEFNAVRSFINQYPLNIDSHSKDPRIDLIIKGVLARHDLDLELSEELLYEYYNQDHHKISNIFLDRINLFFVTEFAFVSVLNVNHAYALDDLDEIYLEYSEYNDKFMMMKILNTFLEINYHLDEPLDDMDEFYIENENQIYDFENNYIDFYHAFSKAIYLLKQKNGRGNLQVYYLFVSALRKQAPVEERLRCIYYLLKTDRASQNMTTSGRFVDDLVLNDELNTVIQSQLTNYESLFLHLIALVIKFRSMLLLGKYSYSTDIYLQIKSIQDLNNFYLFDEILDEWKNQDPEIGQYFEQVPY